MPRLSLWHAQALACDGGSEPGGPLRAREVCCRVKVKMSWQKGSRVSARQRQGAVPETRWT
jgi:hypothetical protein